MLSSLFVKLRSNFQALPTTRLTRTRPLPLELDQSYSLAAESDALRQFVVVFGLSLIIPLFLIAAINYLVNPYGSYPPRIFPPKVANALAGTLRLLDLPRVKPGVLVLGSSRSRNLPPEALQCYTGLDAYNAAYQGATPEGYYALASHVLATQVPVPRLFIIGLDVEAFHNANLFGDKISNVEPLKKYLKGQNRLEYAWLDATSLFSIGQLSDSLSVLRKHYEGGTLAQRLLNASTAAPANSAQITSYKPKRLKKGKHKSETDSYWTATYLSRFGGYTAISENQKNYFEALLREANANGVHVKIFLTALHPSLVKALDDQGYYPRRLQEVRASIQDWQARYQFDFYDFSTPDKFGGTNTDFANLAHLNPFNSTLLVTALFKADASVQKCDITPILESYRIKK